VIGPAGGRRLLALLVVGDAVLGGLVVGVLLRPSGEESRPVRSATSTTRAQPVAATHPAGGLQFAPEIRSRTTTPVAPVPTTTLVAPTAPSAPPPTLSRDEPTVAEVTTTTVPQSAPSTTVATTTTVTAPVEVDDETVRGR
jgi:hypothetical protein